MHTFVDAVFVITILLLNSGIQVRPTHHTTVLATVAQTIHIEMSMACTHSLADPEG